MKEERTMWKKLFDYRFISAEELEKDITVTIEAIEQDEAFNGREKEQVTVLKFKGAKKGMILNKTNAKTISSILKSPYIEDWIGQQITLTTKQVSAFGTQVEAIRVKQDFKNIQV
jgi:DNA polymerase III delta subunit